MNDQDNYDGSFAPRTTGQKQGGYIPESTGHITSDSLAAESLRASDGGFAGDELHQGRVRASDVPSRSTTANVTDSSNAIKLGAAPDATSRLGGEGGETYRTPGDERRLRGDFDGADSGAAGTYDTSSGGPQDSYGGQAPRAAYASDQIDGRAAPKGRNITEGGFDSDNAPNASFNPASTIGTKNDPGRVAEQRFEKANARSGDDVGYDGANATGAGPGGNQGGFENLGGDSSA